MIKLPFDLKDIKPGDFSYLTKRKLENGSGEETGEIFVWRETGAEDYKYILQCPYCSKEQEGKTNFERRPYRVRCSGCNKGITLPRLKDEAKRKPGF